MSIAGRIRWLLDHAAHGCGVLRAFERRPRTDPIVLMYHRVLPDRDCVGYPFPSLVMPASMFTAQVAWLTTHAEVVRLGDAMSASPPPASSRRLRVAITFDDGYADNAAIAAPILDRHGIKATFFVTSGFVAGTVGMWYDRAAAAVLACEEPILAATAAECGVTAPSAIAIDGDRVGAWVEAMKQANSPARLRLVDELERRGGRGGTPAGCDPMRPADVAALAASGHEIGAHSVSHEILTLLDDRELTRELAESKAQVSRWSGVPVAGFCYPNGSCDARVVAATRAAGYRYACTTVPPRRAPVHDAWSLPRVDITSRRVVDPRGRFDAVAFRAEVCGFHEALR